MTTNSARVKKESRSKEARKTPWLARGFENPPQSPFYKGGGKKPNTFKAS